HDAGGCRLRTVQALPEIVLGLRQIGLEPKTIQQMSADPSEIHRMWGWWETRFTRKWQVDTIPSHTGEISVLRLGLARFPLSAAVVSGKTVRRGDFFGEIHFGNVALAQWSGQKKSGGLRAFHAVMQGLTDLSYYMDQHEKYQNVQVVGGMTVLDASNAIEKLGFERVELHGWKKLSMRIFLVFLLAMYHQEGWRSLRRFARLEPSFFLMSREVLRKKYGSRYQA
ncbi:MAG: polysaccharide deacetylase family protein, partial [Firmicutes bacterium]|nr:polysaccharide deacetylase family protein [Bacillota bacterium]